MKGKVFSRFQLLHVSCKFYFVFPIWNIRLFQFEFKPWFSGLCKWSIHVVNNLYSNFEHSLFHLKPQVYKFGVKKISVFQNTYEYLQIWIIEYDCNCIHGILILSFPLKWKAIDTQQDDPVARGKKIAW